MMWREALQEAYFPNLDAIIKSLTDFVERYKNQPMLAMTHGQSATPTTVGKEFAVFVSRIIRQTEQIKQHKLLVVKIQQQMES